MYETSYLILSYFCSLFCVLHFWNFPKRSVLYDRSRSILDTLGINMLTFLLFCLAQMTYHVQGLASLSEAGIFSKKYHSLSIFGVDSIEGQPYTGHGTRELCDSLRPLMSANLKIK